MTKNMKRSLYRKVNTSTPLVDIALLTCGLVEPGVLEACINSIKREIDLAHENKIQCAFHAILNGVSHSSQSAKFVEEIIPDFCQKRYSRERLSFGEAANRVIKQGNAPLVLFITDDIILQPGALLTLVRRMDNADIGLCGMKLIYPYNSTDPIRPAGRVQHIGHAIDVNLEVIHPLMGWKPDNPKCNVSRYVQSVTGGVFMVRRNVFLKVGGFYSGFRGGYYEDTDLCFQIRRIGKQIFIDTEAVAEHVTNASFNKAIAEGQYIPINENRSLFLARNRDLLVVDDWTFW
jgi:hypothetical protein